MTKAGAALIVASAWACACSYGCTTTGVTPSKDRTPTASATAPPAISASAPPSSAPSAAAAELTVPVFTAERFAPAGTAPSAVFAIEGAIVVVDGQRVLRVVGDGVEAIGKIPSGSPQFGENSITSVTGRYPDSVGAFFISGQGRAPMPTYTPLTGKGATHTEGAGGGFAELYAARLGDSTILAASSSIDGQRLITVRGPKLSRRFIPAKSMCKAGEVISPGFSPDPPAMTPTAFESTTEGTLVSLGTLCSQRGPAVEIWDKKTGTSRIVELGNVWQKHLGYGAALLKGAGDELWAYADPYQPVLHYVDGNFVRLPLLASPITNAFVSPSGQLFAVTTTQTLHKLVDGKWTNVGRLTAPVELRGLLVDAEGSFWGASGAKVYKLRETSRVRPLDDDACKEWFVYLYPAASNTGTGQYTYPTTRKALSTFAEAPSIGLVELGDYPKHVGVTVTSKSQGEAVIAHVKANMTNEDPKLFCYAPKTPRKIDMNAK